MFGLIGKINFKNSFENAIWLMIGAALATTITYSAVSKTAVVSSETVLNALIPAIKEAINKETVQNSIHNAISNNFEKIKNTEGLEIIIKQDPLNNLKPKTAVIKEGSNNSDCAVSNAQYNKLSDGEKRRINRWISD
jgi:hypothetical protein